jgi:hypothetical protein
MPLITTTSSAAAKGLGFASQTSGTRTSPVSGYHVWLDAADASTFTYSSGTVVSRWTDKSPNGYQFEPATSSMAPSRSGTQNSKSTVVFDGTDDGLAAVGSTSNWKFLHDGTICTVFVIYKVTKTISASQYEFTLLDTTKYAFDSVTADYPGYRIEGSIQTFSGNNLNTQYQRVNTGTILSGQSYPATAATANYLNGPTYNSWDIMSGFIDPNNATTSNKITAYNTNDPFPNSPATGVTNNGWSGPSSSTPQGGLSIGRVDNSYRYYAFQGEIAEIIIYKNRLSLTDRTSMVNYFKNKWNIA